MVGACRPAGNWVRFAQSAPAIVRWVAASRPKALAMVFRAPRQIGFVLHDRLSPGPARERLTSLRTISPAGPCAAVANWVRFAHLTHRIGFVSHDRPVPAVRPGGNWVRFAHLHCVPRPPGPVPPGPAGQIGFVWRICPIVPRPWGLVPPGVAGNWVRFAHFALPLSTAFQPQPVEPESSPAESSHVAL